MKASFIKNLCEKLGESNKATYAVVAIATAKGIFRPIFTMADKHEEKETKKYAAIREGLTEVVAIPTYIGVGKLAEVVAGKLKGLSPEKLEVAKHNANFIGVCVAALFVIPALASIVTKPFSKKVQNKPVQEQKLDIKEHEVPEVVAITDSSLKKPDDVKQYHQVVTKGYAQVKPEMAKVGAAW
ncbi:hypothetical protein J6S88_07880 [bacterium]|nr:hypothetical protein [bacterium]